MPTPSPTCTTCHGAGVAGGCPDCHGTPTPAALTPPASSGRTWKFYAGIATAVAVLGALAFMGYRQFNKPSSATASASTGTSASGSTASANTDPLKPPAPTASAVAFKKPECPAGALWDTTKEVCVMLPPPVTFPSALTAEIKLPCPSACPSTSSSAVASASAPPAPKPPVPIIPATVVIKPAKMRDISEVGDLAAFPSGN